MTTFAYVIAGSEATGGAGFQVDLKTFQQMGVYGVGTLSCIVAFDPKNGWGHRFHPVPADLIAEQFEAATATYDLDTVKIGMLGTPQTIDIVAKCLASQPWKNVVLDPVLICKGQEPGAALDTDTALREKILPLATVVTPNNFEACTLSGLPELKGIDDMVEAGKRICQLGPVAAVVKGGVDLPGPDAVDVLVERKPDGTFTSEAFSVPKIGEERVSGAGCTFAASITAALALGASVRDAVATAKDNVTKGIKARVHAHTPFDTVWQGAF
ncbi:MAG: hydroxymethylpyrimidine/phosphomethylpyrimidine kinase [Bifidobacteriaceae bacterium]|nr:hydroxymethylpyrimidine/phosphomethylpyrimidine kinase [Bifidobacteriaceae bacterium]